MIFEESNEYEIFSINVYLKLQNVNDDQTLIPIIDKRFFDSQNVRKWRFQKFLCNF